MDVSGESGADRTGQNGSHICILVTENMGSGDRLPGSVPLLDTCYLCDLEPLT